MINGLLCIALAVSVIAWPGAGQAAVEFLQSLLQQSQAGLAASVFIAAFLEAIFPITLAFPGSFFLIVAVVVSEHIENARIVIFLAGTIGIVSGNFVSFSLAKIDAIATRIKTKPSRTNATVVIAA